MEMTFEAAKRAWILTHQKAAFSLAFHLLGDFDAAYIVAAAGLAEALEKDAPPTDEAAVDAFALIISKCRAERPAQASFDAAEPDASLRLISRALMKLSQDERALVLLRDQLNLPYTDVARALGVSEPEARHRTIEARIQLRRHVEWEVRLA